MKDRVAQLAVKLVIEPLFEADFRPCSYGFRPQKPPRMALSAIVQHLKAGSTDVVDVDLKPCFETIDHDLLADDVVVLATTADAANHAWQRLQSSVCQVAASGQSGQEPSDDAG